MRFKVKIGRETVLALKEIETILQAETEEKLTRGDLLTKSWNDIFPIKDDINWKGISEIKISTIIKGDYGKVSGINTTFNIDEDVLNTLKEFQFSLAKKFGQLIYLPYVLKLILVARIIKSNGKLEQYMEWETK